MLKHIVLVKLKDDSQGILPELKERLLLMNDKVDAARLVKVHLDELHSERSFDLMLEVSVDNMETLDVYQNDPYHQTQVLPFIKAHAQNVKAIDYFE